MIKLHNIYTILLALFLFLAGGVAIAQNVETLRHDKELAESELRKTNRELQKTLKSANSMIKEMELLNAEIKDQDKFIKRLNEEVSRLNRRQRAMQDSIALLKKELEGKQQSYANAIRNMGRRGNQYDQFLFVFSAESFQQSLRRIRYLKEFTTWRKKQAGAIVAKQEELSVQQVLLDSVIAERKGVIELRTHEANQLKAKKREKNEFVSQLRKNEKSLRKEADKQRARINKLNKQIDDIIAEEARKAAERARAEAEAEAARLAAEKGASQGDDVAKTDKKKETDKKKTKDKSDGGQYQMTRADRELSGSFEKNKGKLPFPIQGQYRIVGHFGLQKHPEFKYLDKNNLGIDIETTPGTKARAIFDGEVARVFSFGGAEKAVMIRHGNYYTVYTGLIEVYVKAGDKVKIRQDLGVIYSDPKDNNRTRLSFQIRKEMEKLNPEHWLDM